MNKRVLLFNLYIIISSLVYSQVDSVHIPWNLEGANERIEAHRKGIVNLEFKLPDGTILSEQVPVKLELLKHKFIFGTSLSETWSYDHDDSSYKKYLKKVHGLFNYTTQTIFWQQAHGTEGSINVPQYVRDDIQWALDNNLSIKIMPLVWHEVLPEWLKESTDSAAIDASIRYHIQYLLEEFPEIKEWGVYNEAVAAFKNHTAESGITRWVEYKGGVTPAVEYLFNLVNEIAPDNKYINNHYTYKEQAFKELNQHLLNTDAGLGAVGIQTHMHDEPNMLSETEVWDFLEAYSVYGNLQLTEVTVPSSVPFKDWTEIQKFEALISEAMWTGKPRPFRPSTPAWEIYQAAYLKDFYTLSFSHPAVEAIIYWTASDLNAWRGAAGGLLDMEHNPKPAFYTLKELIREEWHTKVDEQTQSDGSLSFNGFYGEYSGFVTINNINYLINFSHMNEDSTIVITIDDNSTCETKFAIDTQTACNEYTWIDGITYAESNETATYTLTAANGCDSIVTLNLTILESSSGTDVQTACESYTWIDGNTYTESNQEATFLLTNSMGCDSVVSLDLEIIQIDNELVLMDTMLMATQENAIYQWLICGNDAVIKNEDAQYFIPDGSGSYAVIVSQENCSDTSNCVSINVVGFQDYSRDDILTYPNPAREVLYIDFASPYPEAARVILYDMMGKTFFNELMHNNQFELNTNDVRSGIYLLKVDIANIMYISKIQIQ
ncbi:endo-1,4-beta-xylanase [Bacteroidota bacterium]